jgi:Fe2+ or Zn2+ uptake regulation protein
VTTSQQLLDKLEDEGYHVTRSRRQVLDAMLARRDGFTTEELVAAVQGVGRATVYRTIRLLVAQGLVCKLSLEDGAPRYTLSEMGHHHHLVCVRCGNVREFPVRDRAGVGGAWDEDAGTVMGHRIEVYVLCPHANNNPRRTGVLRRNRLS